VLGDEPDGNAGGDGNDKLLAVDDGGQLLEHIAHPLGLDGQDDDIGLPGGLEVVIRGGHGVFSLQVGQPVGDDVGHGHAPRLTQAGREDAAHNDLAHLPPPDDGNLLSLHDFSSLLFFPPGRANGRPSGMNLVIKSSWHRIARPYQAGHRNGPRGGHLREIPHRKRVSARI